MSLDHLTPIMLPAVEEELKKAITQVDQTTFHDLYTTLAYHMGWEGNEVVSEARGKRIRPLIVLLSTAAAGGDWKVSLPAAAAVELVHNFSLIHDDIEDNSPYRRGSPTVWVKWGIPLAINAGDAMFSLAHLTLFNLYKTCSPDMTLAATHLLQQTCLRLTQGQHLDIAYEKLAELSLEEYWNMVGGKTAALIATSSQLGALLAGATADVIKLYEEFGSNLGLAYQAQDDLLGIWGDIRKIGKSIHSDLTTGKKSLPILYGLHNKGGFFNRWLKGPIREDEIATLVLRLEEEGAKEYTIQVVNRLTNQALKALDNAQPQGEAGMTLRELTLKLLHRTM